MQILPDFTKLYTSSGLRMTLSADGRNYKGSAGEADCCRHYFTINGQECQNPGTIEVHTSQRYNLVPFTDHLCVSLH